VNSSLDKSYHVNKTQNPYCADKHCHCVCGQ